MPFTVSHAAAVLPLKMFRPRWFSLTGLMAGAMAPDLIYFLLMQTTHRGVSHSWPGLFVFCLPAGVVFSFTFQWLFKQPVIYHLPRPLDRRLSGLTDQPFRVRGVRAWVVLVSSVLIGALSHFAWDSFTHGAGEMVKLFPVLNQSLTLFGVTRSLCRFLQHLSTISGAVALGVFALKSRFIPPPATSRTGRTPGQKLRFWLLGGIASTLFAVLVVVCFDRMYDLHAAKDLTQYDVVSAFGLAGWAGFFYYSCLVGLFTSRRRSEPVRRAALARWKKEQET